MDTDLTQHPGGILLVDDNDQNLELLEAYLDELDVVVRTATDGERAIAEVERCPPDLILLDIMMPRMSGFQVCERLKSRAETRDIPVVMVTALTEVGDVERALELGADDYLIKPVNKLELVTRARSLLRVRQLRRQLDAAESAITRLRDTDDPGA